jgi:hypothetical protein
VRPFSLYGLGVIGGILLGAGCKSRAAGERRWVACTCEYVTDFDQPGHIDVEVCSEASDPREPAASCARNLGVGAVTGCECSARPAKGCEARDGCRSAASGESK